MNPLFLNIIASYSKPVMTGGAIVYPDTSINRWKLDESSGVQYIDVNGGKNGAITGSDYTWTAGKFGNSLSLTGSTTYGCTTISSSVFGSSSAFSCSISFWFNPTDAQTSTGILSWANPPLSGNPWILVQRQNATTVQIYVDGGYRFNFAASDGTWYHVVLTYDPGAVLWSCYVNNGAPTTYSGLIGSNIVTSNMLFFGSGFNGYFRGLIDNVAIYNKVLNSTDVANLYNNGSV